MSVEYQKVGEVFIVKGQGSTYEVRTNNEVPHEDKLCQLKCSDCGVCVHTYLCNCLDSSLKMATCKHVNHVVQLNVIKCTDECVGSAACVGVETMEPRYMEVECKNAEIEPNTPDILYETVSCTINDIVNKYRYIVSCLKIMLEAITKADAQILENTKSSFSKLEPGNKKIYNKYLRKFLKFQE